MFYKMIFRFLSRFCPCLAKSDNMAPKNFSQTFYMSVFATFSTKHQIPRFLIPVSKLCSKIFLGVHISTFCKL
jgi:hypothetical protein